MATNTDMIKIRAPELEPAVAWLNTNRPLSMKDLRGQFVILDFWTYCCINCMHVIPVLREFERRHKNDPVVVIGVHSAKFETEARPERIADAVSRYGIEHPVVVDRDMGIWERFAVRSWPTLVFVKPDGYIAAVAPGEPDPDLLEQFVSEQLAEARKLGTLAKAPYEIERSHPAPSTGLAFPGNVDVAPDGRLAISDSGHHRVLVTASDGRVQECIGSGLRGHIDGAFYDCAFDDPQGLAWDGPDRLWVCDTRNHVVRRVDLKERTVSTVVGTGRMGAGVFSGRGAARSIDLRSPWDVLVHDSTLFIAMAGAHQIWTSDTATGDTGPFAGSGREALIDGPLADAAFAQPSGLALSKGMLFVADSETSSVRQIDLAGGDVATLVGAGLFDFGDVDGPAEKARLQHALGVAVSPDGAVLVADTYNDRIRRIDLGSNRVGTFYRGEDDRALREPACIVAHPYSGFIVADTNHHRIITLSDDGQWAGEMAISGAPTPALGDAGEPGDGKTTAVGGTAGWFTSSMEPDAGSTFGEGDALLSLTLTPPHGWKHSLQSEIRVALEVTRRSDLLVLGQSSIRRMVIESEPMVVTVEGTVERLPGDSVGSELLVTVDAVLCKSGDAARCVPVRGWFRLPITLTRRGDRALGYNLPLPLPRDE